MTLVSRIVRPSVDPRNTRRYSLSGASWTPLSISGLIAWHDTDRLVTIETGVRTLGDQLLTHDAEQTTTSAQPAYTVSNAVFNGHGSIAGDGVDDLLQIASHPDFELSGGFTVYITAAPSDAGFNKDFLQKSSGTQRSWICRRDSSGGFQFLVRNAANSSWQKVIQTGSADNGSAHVFRAMYDGSNAYARIDLSETSLAVPDSNTSTAVIKLSPLVQVPYSEILWINRAVTDASEDAAIMSWLNRRVP